MIKNTIGWFTTGFGVTLGVAAAKYVVECIKKNAEKMNEKSEQNIVIE